MEWKRDECHERKHYACVGPLLLITRGREDGCRWEVTDHIRDVHGTEPSEPAARRAALQAAERLCLDWAAQCRRGLGE